MKSNLNEDQEKKISLRIKVLVLGDSNVGKTCSIIKYSENIFDSDNIATIGIGLTEKIIIKNNYEITLEIWDTAGQERFRSLTKTFFDKVHGVIFMYDITQKKTYDNIENWIGDAKKNSDSFKSIILGNKKDLESERQVTYKDLEKVGIKFKMFFMETSAKTGENIKESFEKLVDELLENKSQEEIIEKYGTEGDGNRISDLKSQSKKNDGKQKKCC